MSASFGINSSRFFLNNSINASMGPESPFDFNLGRQIQREFNLNFDGVYRLPVALFAELINIAFGAERRVETYQVKMGDPASYEVGPCAAAGLAAQSNGFPGSRPATGRQVEPDGLCRLSGHPGALHRTLERAVTRCATKSYDTFGNTFNCKLATRFEITPAWWRSAAALFHRLPGAEPRPAQRRPTSSPGPRHRHAPSSSPRPARRSTRWRNSSAPEPLEPGRVR